MAEARLKLKTGEVLDFRDDSFTSRPQSSVSMKDVISSVSKLQTNINTKLTELVNEEKQKSGNVHRDGKESSDMDGDEFEDDSDDDDNEKIADGPAVKKKRD